MTTDDATLIDRARVQLKPATVDIHDITEADLEEASRRDNPAVCPRCCGLMSRMHFRRTQYGHCPKCRAVGVVSTMGEPQTSDEDEAAAKVIFCCHGVRPVLVIFDAAYLAELEARR